MADPQTYYRPGLRFKVKGGPGGGGILHQECCFKGAEEVRNSDGSLQREETRALWAEFGVAGAEYRGIGADGEPINDMISGEPIVFADIRGGFFDLDLQAEEKGWDEREKELVARHMLRKLREPDCLFLEAETARAPLPWATYEQTHHKQIPVIASQIGAVGAALAYESQNKKRAEVLEKLREAAAQPVPVDDESLAAA